MPDQILLTEHRPSRLPAGRLSSAQAEELYRRHGRHLEIQSPGPATGFEWEMSSKGWVGAFAAKDLHVIVQPKVPIANLARMLQFYHELPVHFFEGVAASATLRDLYDQIVLELSRQVVRLTRQGLHHEYRAVDRELGVVRGRLDVTRMLTRPISTSVPCRVFERTSDIPENQLLAFTLGRVLRSGLCSASVQGEARNAYRLLAGAVSSDEAGYPSLETFGYSRLTERYRTAHSICRLLLASQSATAGVGEEEVVPFLLNMPELFEGLVAKWLAIHLAPDYDVVQQRHRVIGGAGNGVHFYMDIVIRDRQGSTVCVLDTKYKEARLPASADVAQIGYYALIERCHLAGLIVPTANSGWSGASGDVEVFRSPFDLAQDLNIAGEVLVKDLRARLDALASARAHTVPVTVAPENDLERSHWRVRASNCAEGAARIIKAV